MLNGRQPLSSVKEDELPDQVREMSPAERQDYINKQMAERKTLNDRLAELVKKRDQYVVAQRNKASPRAR